MFSVLITSYQEPLTIGKAIETCLRQIPHNGEILVICPDAETTQVIIDYASKDERVKHIQDERKGKPAALNLGLQHAKHDLVVLTDGDVFISENALSLLIPPFEDAHVGAVTARVMSLDSRQNRMGYWSHLLTDAAHQTRETRAEAGAFMLCSGYLFAYRKSLMAHIPEDALAEDAVISHRIAEAGYRIVYAPEARVFVKYPTTYADWLKQKVRSAGGYVQPYITQSSVQMRSFRLEARDGMGFALAYPRTWRERFWTLALFMARLHLWLLVYWRVRLRQTSLKDLWQPVKSTK